MSDARVTGEHMNEWTQRSSVIAGSMFAIAVAFPLFLATRELRFVHPAGGVEPDPAGSA